MRHIESGVVAEQGIGRPAIVMLMHGSKKTMFDATSDTGY